MHIRPNSRRRTLPIGVRTLQYTPGWIQPLVINPWYQGTCGNLTWGKSAGGESINLKTQYKPSCFYNIHFSTAGRIFIGNADIFPGHFTCQESIKQREIKKFTQRLNLKKETLMWGPAARLRLCLRCEVSLKGIVWWPSVERKKPGERIWCGRK